MLLTFAVCFHVVSFEIVYLVRIQSVTHTIHRYHSVVARSAAVDRINVKVLRANLAARTPAPQLIEWSVCPS